MPREATARQALCFDIDGFSLHAAVCVAASRRKRLEQLCRHITRPTLPDERMQFNAAGQAVRKLKVPLRDCTTHLAMSPHEFKQLPIEWPVCGGQIHWFHVRSGSRS
jgi:hypothetical protein